MGHLQCITVEIGRTQSPPPPPSTAGQLYVSCRRYVRSPERAKLRNNVMIRACRLWRATSRRRISSCMGGGSLRGVDRCWNVPSRSDAYELRAESDLADGQDGATFSSAIQAVRSENRDLGPSSARPSAASDILRRPPADPSVDTRDSQLGFRNFPHRGAAHWEESSSHSGAEVRRANQHSQQSARSSHRPSVFGLDHGPKRPRIDDGAVPNVGGSSLEGHHKRQRGAPPREAGSSRPGDESGRIDRALASSQTDALARFGASASDRSAGPERRRIDRPATQSTYSAISEQQFNAALHAIDFAHDIVGFSRAVVAHGKLLQGAGDGLHAAFLQKAAAQFRSRFVSHFEDDICRGKSWGYATACNAVSREAGGEEGVAACKAMADRVSRLHGTSAREAEPKALSLLAASFGRHPRSRTCRNGTIRIAELCRDEGRVGSLNSQSLSLLVNGFSKWPERAETREGTEIIAREIRRRADRPFRLSESNHQELANLVNGCSKWPEAADCRDATVAIAGEVLHRAARREVRLFDFGHQHLANLVNGFGKWPEEANCRNASSQSPGRFVVAPPSFPGLSTRNWRIS